MIIILHKTAVTGVVDCSQKSRKFSKVQIFGMKLAESIIPGISTCDSIICSCHIKMF